MLKILNKKNKSLGFTIIESLIVTGIIAFILAILVSAYPRFRNRSSFSGMAREVALVFREAQVYGLAVKEFPRTRDTNELPNFPPYGVYVGLDPDRPSMSREMIIFSDSGFPDRNDSLYDTSISCGDEGSECMKKITFRGQDRIEKICVSSDDFSSTGSNWICNIKDLHVTFVRPDPEARIYTSTTRVQHTAAQIHLVSSRDSELKKVVRIWVTGQVSIED